MKKRIIRYFKHIIITLLISGTALATFGIYHGASLHYGDDPKMMNWDKDGPYVFLHKDSTIEVNYIRGNKNDGFYIDRIIAPNSSPIPASCYFPIDGSVFNFTIQPNIDTPPVIYNDGNPILAISDIESSYQTLRDFLIANRVIDSNLKWRFGTGHLVLVGDLMDRDFSTTQVLWFIYKLEMDALQHKGRVHFILGNHELKNLQGNYESTSPKYYQIASILGKQQDELYNTASYMGKWIASKNVAERINGVLFTHGGIHPKLANFDLTLEQINTLTRSQYYIPYYPSVKKDSIQFLTSFNTGIAWYRGYFKEELKQADIDSLLAKFNARAIVVGHTLQSKVNSKFNGKVFGIDVNHPKDYHKQFPNKQSEGLLIEKGKFYRILHTGEKKEIS